MATGGDSEVEKLKGTWDYIDNENFDDFMKELGISWVVRTAAKAVRSEKLIISENNGKWTLRSESTFKNTSYEFVPGVEFNETRADGAEIKGTITFSNGRWVHKAVDKGGKVAMIERYLDEEGQQQVVMTCGKVTAKRWYKRA